MVWRAELARAGIPGFSALRPRAPSRRHSLKGNDYRLVVAVAYRFQALYVKFVGTHAQYDAIDAATVEPL
jgi:hypothetical protein